MAAERTHVAHRHHRTPRELTLNVQVEVHRIRSAQLRAVGVDAQRLKETKINGRIAWRGRGKGELVGDRNRARRSCKGVSKTYALPYVADAARSKAKGRSSQVLQRRFFFRTVVVNTETAANGELVSPPAGKPLKETTPLR